jgi:membrane-associated protease RseP (regulator of RpoE activity)
VALRRYVIPALLFVLTLGTTTLVGARLARNFAENRPAFHFESDIPAYLDLLRSPMALLEGLPFSLTLVGILLVHEFGHYLACRYYGVDASLPYFLPAPTFIGTFGAFIRIRSPIYSKRVLFDIGVAGPIAGFVVLIPALAIGLAFSKVLPGMALQGDLVFGMPLIQRVLQELIFPGTAGADLYLHPIARAASVGAFATALNLLPIGQLDGGHIVYSVAQEWHKALTLITALVLLPVGLFTWWGWSLLAVVVLIWGRRHPVVIDDVPLSPGRHKLAWIALAILLLSFSLIPIRPSTGF